MKDALLLIMTPNISLEVWNKKGQLQRELNFYNKLCISLQLNLIIFSYGRNDKSYVSDQSHITVIEMPGWIPAGMPFRIQNIIYHFSSLLTKRKLLKRAKIAKTNQYRAATFGMLLKFFYRIPLIVRMGFYYTHLKPLKKLTKIKEYLRFNYSDGIIVTSSEAKEFITNTYKIEDKKILNMRNAIDLELFYPKQLNKQYDLLFVGRLEKQKNIDLIVNLIANTKLRVLIIGNGRLSDLVSNAVKTNDNITWKQKVNNNDLPFYYNSSNIYLILSQFEGSPKSLLEAMACGIPCIGTCAPGTRECIIDQYTGVFTREQSAEIEQQIQELLNDKPKAATIGHNAAKWVNQECNMDINIEKECLMYSRF
ncbi:MAG: glycosyltransferase family 1 protein [Mucilaginibacter sp.]|nr:glycosyltransferase family 1 protein [Mucilaginibacter sp.]